jgi:acylphosphatase
LSAISEPNASGLRIAVAEYGPLEDRRSPRYTEAMTIRKEESRERRIVHYRGRVQGVGFRYTTREIASQFDVSGYVQNLPDGQVLVVAEGHAAELDSFFGRIQAEMGSYIRSADVVTAPPSNEFESFFVKF